MGMINYVITSFKSMDVHTMKDEKENMISICPRCKKEEDYAKITTTEKVVTIFIGIVAIFFSFFIILATIIIAILGTVTTGFGGICVVLPIGSFISILCFIMGLLTIAKGFWIKKCLHCNGYYFRAKWIKKEEE